MAAAAAAAATAMRGDVEVEMRYLDPSARGRAEAEGSLPVPGGARGDSVPVRVTVRDARRRPEESLPVDIALERTGFGLEALTPSEMAEVDAITPDPFAMETDSAVARRYKDAIARVVQRITGAAWCRTSALVLRRSSIVGVHTRPVGDNAARGPVNDVHCDFTPTSPAIAQMAELGRRVGLSGCRFAVINVWRSVSKASPVCHWPMAVIDSSTVDAGEELVSRVSPENGNHIYNVLASPAHRWYTYPAMRREEMLVFKQFDTDPSRIRFTPHTAFCHPRSPPGAPPRESCEVRVICFFDPEKAHVPALQALHDSGRGAVDPALVATGARGAARHSRL